MRGQPLGEVVIIGSWVSGSSSHGCARVSDPAHLADRRSQELQETCDQRFRRGRETFAERKPQGERVIAFFSGSSFLNLQRNTLDLAFVRKWGLVLANRPLQITTDLKTVNGHAGQRPGDLRTGGWFAIDDH